MRERKINSNSLPVHYNKTSTKILQAKTLSSPPQQFLEDDQQKKYPGKSDADLVHQRYNGE